MSDSVVAVPIRRCSFIYSPGADRFVRAQTRHSLAEAVLHMRCADLDDPTPQPRMIHTYLHFLREFCLESERIVAEKGREFFGPNAFRGLHATYAEDWIADSYGGYRAVSTGVDVDMWLHGFHHWELRRSCAQVDTINLCPRRVGILSCMPECRSQGHGDWAVQGSGLDGGRERY
jgi:hypothetical protein